VHDALALACACGALSTRALGGTDAQPTRAEAEEALS
jgi:sugar/nucleoside kinase (ribokinase family)